jgi:hypothetical protein
MIGLDVRGETDVEIAAIRHSGPYRYPWRGAVKKVVDSIACGEPNDLLPNRFETPR